MASNTSREEITNDAKELVSLLVTYVRQETLDPVKKMGRNLGYGIGGSVLIGLGLVLLLLGLLRLLQQSSSLDGNLSFLPYLVTLGASGAAAALALSARGRRKEKP